MYATAAARSDGLLLLCGGRNAEGTPLGDAFGLARHRDGRWEWAAAPGSMPVARYQHGAVFVGARLHISGGAVGGGRMVDDAASVAVLDTVRVLGYRICIVFLICSLRAPVPHIFYRAPTWSRSVTRSLRRLGLTHRGQ